MGFEPITANYSVFINGTTIIVIYMDDILIAGPNKIEIQSIKNKLRKRFEIINLGSCIYYLDMTVIKDRANRIIRLGQASYIEKFLIEHGIWEFKGTPTSINIEKFQTAEEDVQFTKASRISYQLAIGLLIYAILGTRPNITYAVFVVFRYNFNPNEAYWKAVKRIFRYLR